MSYKVLYRKYRPDSFEQIVGQNSIVNILKNSITSGNIAHAYIFTGPRGTGKTSTAKVFAKALNCTSPKNGEPCGKCDNCINFKTNPDIIEIDAASNNGVDEIRELRSNITLAPSSSKYKVYIIDEVHMLSTGAFNALLKTLEEPPEHAIFILATTEIYKVPITILSRCQRYDFKKIGEKEMIEHLEKICSDENIKYENGALEEIYSLSEGCLRDSLSILDQISKNNEKITVDLILNDYNIISNKKIDKLLEHTFNGNISKVIDELDEYSKTGANVQKMISRMIKYLETIAIDIKIKKENRYNFENIKILMELLNDCYIDARINENTFSMVKLAFLEVAPSKEIKEKEKYKKEEKVEVKEEESKYVVVAGNGVDIRINNTFVEANKKSLENLCELWKSFGKGNLSGINLTEYQPVVASDKYSIFTVDEESLSDLFNIKSETIEKMLKKNDINIKVVAITNERWEKEKNEYVKNRGKKKYEYIEEPQEKMDMKANEEIEKIFLDKTVEIA